MTITVYRNKVTLGKEGSPNVTSAKGRLLQEGTISPPFFGITLEELAYYRKKFCLILFLFI